MSYGPKEVIGRIFEPTHYICEELLKPSGLQERSDTAWGRWVSLDGDPPIYSLASRLRVMTVEETEEGEQKFVEHPEYPPEWKMWFMHDKRTAIAILKHLQQQEGPYIQANIVYALEQLQNAP